VAVSDSFCKGGKGKGEGAVDCLHAEERGGIRPGYFLISTGKKGTLSPHLGEEGRRGTVHRAISLRGRGRRAPVC